MEKFESFVGILGLMTLAFLLSFALVRLGRRWESHKNILVELISRFLALIAFILMICSAPVWIVFYWLSNILTESAIEEKRKAWDNTEETLRRISYDDGYQKGRSEGIAQGKAIQKREDQRDLVYRAYDHGVYDNIGETPADYARKAGEFRATASSECISIVEFDPSPRVLLHMIFLDKREINMATQIARHFWYEILNFAGFDPASEESCGLIDLIELTYLWATFFYSVRDLLIDNEIAEDVQAYFKTGLNLILPLNVSKRTKSAFFLDIQTDYIRALEHFGISPYERKYHELSKFASSYTWTACEDLKEDSFSLGASLIRNQIIVSKILSQSKEE